MAEGYAFLCSEDSLDVGKVGSGWGVRQAHLQPSCCTVWNGHKLAGTCAACSTCTAHLPYLTTCPPPSRPPPSPIPRRRWPWLTPRAPPASPA